MQSHACLGLARVAALMPAALHAACHAGVAPVLCQRVSAACKHKTYAAPAPQAASQGGDGDREL